MLEVRPEMSLDVYYQKLQDRLSTGRYQHSLEVAKLARELARVYGISLNRAYLAGLLHDYAKDLEDEKILADAEKFELNIGPVEIIAPQLLHGPVGARLVKEELGVRVPEILQAIARHTLGSPGMETMDKIIFLADLIEPGRKFPGVEKLRKLAYVNLDQAMIMAYDRTIDYLLERRAVIHPQMIEARNDLLLTTAHR